MIILFYNNKFIPAHFQQSIINNENTIIIDNNTKSIIESKAETSDVPITQKIHDFFYEPGDVLQGHSMGLFLKHTHFHNVKDTKNGLNLVNLVDEDLFMFIKSDGTHTENFVFPKSSQVVFQESTEGPFSYDNIILHHHKLKNNLIDIDKIQTVYPGNSKGIFMVKYSDYCINVPSTFQVKLGKKNTEIIEGYFFKKFKTENLQTTLEDNDTVFYTSIVKDSGDYSTDLSIKAADLFVNGGTIDKHIIMISNYLF